MQIALKMKLQTSSSFRAIGKILLIFSIHTQIFRRDMGEISQISPSHTTVSIWVKKIGYYQLKKKKEKADNWIIILDHSVQVGREKLLNIYGIRESEINFDRALRFTDLQSLRLISKKKWNGEVMHEILEELKKELGTILYAIGDYGSDLRKGLRLSNIKHVHDITHKIALIIESLYRKDEEYVKLTKQMGKKRQKWQMSKYAHLLPPKLRNKSRYQNIHTISDWGKNILKYQQKIKNNTDKKEEKKQICFIKKYKKFIEELDQINKQINTVEKLIKTKGLNKKTAEKSLQYLSGISGEKASIIKKELKKYFDEFLTLLPDQKKILATSDIIESAFGKYKNYLSSNYMTGITDLSLCMAAFTSPLTKEEIEEAMNTVHMKNLNNWVSENIGDTLLKKRKNAFSTA